jgi:hypothetical protein
MFTKFNNNVGVTKLSSVQTSQKMMIDIYQFLDGNDENIKMYVKYF